MGRFDALTQIEETKKTSPSPAASLPAKTQAVKEATQQRNEPKTSAKRQSSLSTSHSPPPSVEEKPEKYTTHLEPSLVKKLKLYATEHDMKDYQVMKKALLLYFEQVEKTKDK